MGPGLVVSSNLAKDVNVIGNFVFEFHIITSTSGVHIILFSHLICNHLRADGTPEQEVRIFCNKSGVLHKQNPGGLLAFGDGGDLA